MSGDPFEGRLEELREEAVRRGRVDAEGVHASGGPMPGTPGGAPPADTVAGRPGYRGKPLLKPPVWTWEIPVYFFIGGVAVGAAVIGWAARWYGSDADLVRAAVWIALLGTLASTVLLIMDLGRPARFLNMLRVFKWRSPMSVGVWGLTAFGGTVSLAVLGAELERLGRPGADEVGSVLLGLGTWLSAPLGALVATYTGVLIGATAVPAWNQHRGALPLHFGTAGLGSAAALLELLGFRVGPLWWIGLAAASIEAALGVFIELGGHGASDRALREGGAGWTIRAAALLAGPVSLVLRVVGWVPAAAAAFLLGSLVSRFGWMAAGRASAEDPRAALERYAD